MTSYREILVRGFRKFCNPVAVVRTESDGDFREICECGNLNCDSIMNPQPHSVIRIITKTPTDKLDISFSAAIGDDYVERAIDLKFKSKVDDKCADFYFLNDKRKKIEVQICIEAGLILWVSHICVSDFTKIMVNI